MNYNDIWCNIRDSHQADKFAQAVADYLNRLKEKECIAGWKLTRRKFGFGPPELGEFHVQIAFEDLAQMDKSFFEVIKHEDPELDRLHGLVYAQVTEFKSALYRDFPDRL